MKRFPILITSILLSSFAVPQTSHHYPTPPPSLDPESQDQPQTASSHRINASQMQKDADDLARTAQTIPSDVATIRKGMLPKGVIEKLKQIEKLSKRLRTELNQ